MGDVSSTYLHQSAWLHNNFRSDFPQNVPFTLCLIRRHRHYPWWRQMLLAHIKCIQLAKHGVIFHFVLKGVNRTGRTSHSELQVTLHSSDSSSADVRRTTWGLCSVTSEHCRNYFWLTSSLKQRGVCVGLCCSCVSDTVAACKVFAVASIRTCCYHSNHLRRHINQDLEDLSKSMNEKQK